MSSSAPWAIPTATPARLSAEYDSSGTRCSGPSMHASPSRTKDRSAGTKTSLTTKSWLPVPARPDTDQVSLISTSEGGRTIIRTGG